MAPRRKYRLTDKSYRESIDLTEYRQTIIDTINHTVPGKNPSVSRDYFSTDLLSQREAVLIGMALAKIPELNRYGKTITTFRLFDGRTYESETARNLAAKLSVKGGRLK